MLGCGKYMSRDELLDLKVTGISAEVSEFTQKLFDKGHAAEASIRPHIEKLIGAELYPVNGDGLPLVADLYPVTGSETIGGLDLLASFDGLTMAGDVVFEHKLWNEGLASLVETEDLPKYIRVQLEQQIRLADAEKAIFVVSDGTPEKMVYCWYEPDPELWIEIFQGWKQFDIDLGNHTPAIKQTVEAAPVAQLPAITYKLNGLAIISNLEEYHSAANDLVEASRVPMDTDQDFADSDARNKAFKKAEDNIALVCDQVIGEIQDVDKFRRDLMDISGLLRQARLNGEKAVKNRKEELRVGIIAKARKELDKHVEGLNAQFSRPYFEMITPGFREAIKGKKNLDSIQSAVNDVLAQSKIALSDMASRVIINTKTLNDLATDHKFLFHDAKDLIFKDADDFRNLVTSRISDHQRDEAMRAEEIRLRDEQTPTAQAEAANTGSEEVEKRIRNMQIDNAERQINPPIMDPEEVLKIIEASLIENGIGKRTASNIARLIVSGKIERTRADFSIFFDDEEAVA
jgi:predicted phage-related endonuclease